jgi:hypothetical protein
VPSNLHISSHLFLTLTLGVVFILQMESIYARYSEIAQNHIPNRGWHKPAFFPSFLSYPYRISVFGQITPTTNSSYVYRHYLQRPKDPDMFAILATKTLEQRTDVFHCFLILHCKLCSCNDLRNLFCIVLTLMALVAFHACWRILCSREYPFSK